MQSKSKRRTPAWLILDGCCLAVTAGYFFLVLLQGREASAPASAVQGSKNVSYPLPSTPTRLYNDLPPVKQTIEAQAEQQRRNGLTTTPSGATKPALPTPNSNQMPIPAASTPAGDGQIIDSGLAPFAATVYTFQNQWYTRLNGGFITVYAGAICGNGAAELPRPWQGIVKVVVSSIDNSTNFPAESGEYQAPIKDGVLRIVGAQGKRLILHSENSAVLYFDVPARSFVSSLTAIIPTAAPQ